jgi:hypothetical protein
MARRCIGGLGVASGRAVAAAITRRAKMRAAFDDFAWNADVRQLRVVARGLRPASRVHRNAASVRRVGRVRALWYTFVRVHKSLRTSPATAAGIEKRLWLMEDVVRLIKRLENIR